MLKAYCFSFDRETYRGEFPTRESAATAGIDAARAHGGPVEAVFVAKRVATNPMADLHAEAVVDSMRQRMADKTGDADYLASVNEQQLADLDAAIEHAVVAWLDRQKLTPAPRITAVSEHPVPAARYHHTVQAPRELSLIGGESE